MHFRTRKCIWNYCQEIGGHFCQPLCVKSLWFCGTYMCQWAESSLFQVMVCRLLGAKPLPISMTNNSQAISNTLQWNWNKKKNVFKFHFVCWGNEWAHGICFSSVTTPRSRRTVRSTISTQRSWASRRSWRSSGYSCNHSWRTRTARSRTTTSRSPSWKVSMRFECLLLNLT